MGNLKVSGAFIVLLLLILPVYQAKSAVQQADEQRVNIKEGQSVTLRASSAGGVAFQWLKDELAIPGADKDSYVVNTGGKYQVLSTNQLSCRSEISDPVFVTIAVPTADVSISKTSAMSVAGAAIPFNYLIGVKNNGSATANAVKVRDDLPPEIELLQLIKPAKGNALYNAAAHRVTWEIASLNNGETADLNMSVKATKGGTIRNTATVSANENDPNQANNSATDIRLISNLTVPNVFTPNGDGKNETFIIPGLQQYPDNELSIVNRWGGTVFQKKGYVNEWDGRGLNEGTYFYVLRVKTPQGNQEIYRGYITLARGNK